MKKVIALSCDTEFTNFKRESGDLITTALVEILEDYTLGREAYWTARPYSPKYFTDESVKVHGISYFKAMTFPHPKVTCLEILRWLKPLMDQFTIPMVMHGNGKLDYKWMESFFRREDLHYSLYKCFDGNECINTIELARKHLKHIAEPVDLDWKGELVKKYSLPNVARHYGISADDHHNALFDARATAQIYCNIMKGVDTWSGDLFSMGDK